MAYCIEQLIVKFECSKCNNTELFVGSMINKVIEMAKRASWKVDWKIKDMGHVEYKNNIECLCPECVEKSNQII